MATFYNFALKIGSSWTKKIDKSILETWNVSDVIVCLVYLFLDKKIKYAM